MCPIIEVFFNMCVEKEYEHKLGSHMSMCVLQLRMPVSLSKILSSDFVVVCFLGCVPFLEW